jgi:hypothetical protein
MYFRLRHRKDSDKSTTKTAAHEEPTSKTAASEQLTPKTAANEELISKAAGKPCKTEPVKKVFKKKKQVKKVDKHTTMSSSEEESILEMLEDLAISGSGSGSGAGARAESGDREKLERSLSKSAKGEKRGIKRVLQIKSKLNVSKSTPGTLFTTVFFLSNFRIDPISWSVCFRLI